MSAHPIALADTRAAATGLNGITTRTPLLENADVNEMLGGRLLLKAENLQRTGAFKIRGAYWRMRHMSTEERARGVVTYSSGNHALGVSRAARILGSSAVIVMPADAPEAKKAATRALGAEVVTFQRNCESSDAVVEGILQETGRLISGPSTDPLVLAGAGTAALELQEQAQELQTDLDVVLVPCGGGGLTAATAVVMAEALPRTRVFAAEPDLFDDTRRSPIAGERVGNPTGRRTICDAIMTPIPSAVTFPINHALLAGGLVATDAEVRAAMRFAYDHFRIVTETGAVVGLAAVLTGKVPIERRAAATFITGGNIDPASFADLIGASSKTQ